MTLGIAFAALTFYSSSILFLWMLPASLGLVLSGPAFDLVGATIGG